jgi:serine/threonine-protein kinase
VPTATPDTNEPPDSRQATSEASGATTTVSAEPAAAPAIPQKWGHLKLLEHLGAGAFGDVYRAWDAQLDRQVALKLLRRDLREADVALAEGRMLARVRHPNVVSVFGAARDDGRVGVWMEFVKGHTLSDLLREQGAFGARETALIGLDVCRALAAVHAAGLIHRDVKAQNVMREAGGRILLTDFGAGLDLARNGAAPGRVSGTPLYMAPEAFGGEASRSTDLYSLGVLLFHLASNEYPVAGATLDALVESHRAGKRRLLRDVRPDLPDGFIRVVEKAIALRPGDRYETAGAMEAELQALLGGSPPSPAAARANASSRPILWSLAALAVAGLALWSLSERVGPQPVPPTTTMAVSPVTTTPATAAAPFEAEARLFRKRGERVEALQPASRVGLNDRLFLEIRATRDAYVYVVNEDDAGHAYLLFPLPGAHSNPLPGASPVRLPGKILGAEREWTVTSEGGRERILVVASPTRLEDLEQELGTLPVPQPGVLAAPLPAAVGARLRGLGGLTDPQKTEAATVAALSRTATHGGADQRVWSRVFELSNPRGEGQ